MTSNIGARDIKNMGQGIGFSPSDGSFDYAKMKTVIQDALRRVFNPEFLNRVDDVIVFKPLEKDDILKIIENMADELFKRIKDLGYSIEISKGAKEFLVEKGFDAKYGARPLRRAIQRFVEDPLAEELLSAEKAEGSVVKIKMNGARDALAFDWKEPGASETSPDAAPNERSEEAKS
jgi:ATP-dependent Clp protease ATP-binding subunit ClpC